MMSNQENTISLPIAQTWARKWREVEGTYNAHHKVHGFLIPKEDLIELLSENIDAVRVYIGVDEENTEKLMLVGTKHNQETNVYVDMLPGKTPEGKIYDFTNPCPPMCDDNSALNNLDNE